MTTATLPSSTGSISRLLSFFGSSAPSDPSTPLNEIVIRKWDLNENSTHYDKLVAAPSDEDLIKFWAGWAGIMLFTGVLCTSIWIPLVFSKKVKKNPFNYYLLFLLFPDMIVAWICGFTCLSNALAGHFTSTFMCQFQSFYMIASICANGWLNAVVAYQLYTMLSSAQKFQRYTPPTHKQVTAHACAVYAYSIFLALWGNLGFSWWPHKTRLTIGAACIPMDYSHASTAFFYGVFFPLLFGIPLAYVCWAGYQIYKHQMLPPSGRRRILAIYFFRLAAVFLIMWLPGLLLLFVTGAWLDPWVEWVGGSWSHLQGAVSALVSLLKPDIWKAVVTFWLCQKKGGSSADSDDAPSSTRSSFITRWSIRRSIRGSLFGGSSKQQPRLSSKKPTETPVSMPSGMSDSSVESENENKVRCFLHSIEEEMLSEDPHQTHTTSIVSSLRDVTSAAPMEDESDRLLCDAAPIHWNELSTELANSNDHDSSDDDESVITDVCESEQPVDWEDDISVNWNSDSEEGQDPVDLSDSDPELGQSRIWTISGLGVGDEEAEKPVNWNSDREERQQPHTTQPLHEGTSSFSDKDNFQDELEFRACVTSKSRPSLTRQLMAGVFRNEPDTSYSQMQTPGLRRTQTQTNTPGLRRTKTQTHTFNPLSKKHDDFQESNSARF